MKESKLYNHVPDTSNTKLFSYLCLPLPKTAMRLPNRPSIALLFSCVLLASSFGEKTDRPNIIVFLVDDYDKLSKVFPILNSPFARHLLQLCFGE